ncbi:MAG: ABC transporter ATP-binding protein/permease [Deltaproteobacteria bacterium]|nr:ABC transporter ATP-binding protein/permease [Deltaproteobacteria bacterium]
MSRAVGWSHDGGFVSGLRAGGAVPVSQRLEYCASRLKLEVESVHARYGEVEELLASCAPALLQLEGKNGEKSWLLVLRSRSHGLSLLGQDRKVRRVTISVVAAALRDRLDLPAAAEIESLLERLVLSPRKRPKAREALLRERLGGEYVGGCWHLRLPPGSSFSVQFRAAGLGKHLALFLGSYVVQYLLFLLSWLLLGRGALQGLLSRPWLLAWALLLFTIVPLRLVSTWSRAKLAVGFGALLKRRLLQGALEQRPEEVRCQGTGQLLGRVVESEAVESMAMNGGFLAVAGVMDLGLAFLVVAAGVSGVLHFAALSFWLLLTGVVTQNFLGVFRGWTKSRLRMTHDFVERLLGHRTRLAQEPRSKWHEAEDRLLDDYLGGSVAVDSAKAYLIALVPRGWLVVSGCVLAPAFIWGLGSQGELAIGIGGMLAAHGGFSKISEGSMHLSRAWVSWSQSAGLFRAAERAGRDAPAPGVHAENTIRRDEEPEVGQLLLEARDLVFRYSGQERPVLEAANLRIEAGDHWLLEGPSGGGKSTLAAVLSGLRKADSGLLLRGGLDLPTLGSTAWRSSAVCAPQFHENHVFSETFAFNLLMGRGWPPTPSDLTEAEEVCRDLGLGELLGRMPGGLMQMVGETGWQLSHGERSRLFIARALLQQAEIVILDESFAALDPGNHLRALEAARRRAPALLLIAHP